VCSIQLAIYSLDCLFFWCLMFWALCRFWILILYLLNGCSKIFSQAMCSLMNLVIVSCDVLKFCVFIWCNLFCQFFFLLTGQLELCSENNCLYLRLPVLSLFFLCSLKASCVCLPSKSEALCLILNTTAPKKEYKLTLRHLMYFEFIFCSGKKLWDLFHSSMCI
jgi:hypothetical protein